MVWVMVVVRVMVRVRVECWGFDFLPEPSKECVKVSHVIFECRVINHHPCMARYLIVARALDLALLSL